MTAYTIDPDSVIDLLKINPEDACHTCDYPDGCTHPALRAFDELEAGKRRVVHSCACHLEAVLWAGYMRLALEPGKQHKAAKTRLLRSIYHIARAEEDEEMLVAIALVELLRTPDAVDSEVVKAFNRLAKEKHFNFSASDLN